MKLMLIYWVISTLVTFLELNRRDLKRSTDGVTGYTPGFNVLLALFTGPVLFPYFTVVFIRDLFRDKVTQ